jgi:hypothetical protein
MNDQITADCFLCQRAFAFGQHRYYGRHIDSWGVSICSACLEGNHDGVVPERHPQLEAHLRSKGIEVRRNAKGWIDIPR